MKLALLTATFALPYAAAIDVRGARPHALSGALQLQLPWHIPAPSEHNSSGVPVTRTQLTGDSPETSEQDCIVRRIDFSNSTVGSLMTRGFPLFAEFGLNSGKVSDAYFELEPMYDFNIARWKEYTSNSSSVWIKQERKYSGGRGGNRIDTRSFLYQVGYDALISGFSDALRSAAFENMYGSTFGACSENKYCRDALAFVESVGGDPTTPGYGMTEYKGPLGMRSPFSTEFAYTDPDGVKFSKAYLEALGALPEAYEREAYLAFGKRFGLTTYAHFFEFSYKNVSVAGERFITVGSNNYQGQECYNPEPSDISYSVVSGGSWLADTLSPVQKARLETLSDVTNLVDMVTGNTVSPTLSPSLSSTLSLSPTVSPTVSPALSLAPSLSPGRLLVICALLCTLVTW